MRKKGKGGKVTRLYCTTTETVFDEIMNTYSIEDKRTTLEDSDQIFEATMKENETRFSQSLQLPSMQQPLRTILGFIGDTPECAAILAGNYKYRNDVDHFANLFL